MQLPVQCRNRHLQIPDNVIRQHSPQIRGCHAGPVGGIHLPEPDRCPVLQKILYPLGRSQESRSWTKPPANTSVFRWCRIRSRNSVRRKDSRIRRVIRGFFDFPLQFKPRQRMLRSEILRPHTHQQGCVAVFRIPGMIAHPVHHRAARLRSRGNHVPARTHAEGIHAAPVLGMACQLIGRRPQPWMPGERAVLAPVNHLPGMLNPHADGKGLLLHPDAVVIEVPHRVPGRMPDAKQNVLRPDFPVLPMVCHDGPGNLALPQDQPLQPGLEADRSAEAEDLLPDRRHHRLQPVRADMGLRIDENLLRCAVGHKGFQHIPEVRGFHAAGQLPVGKRAGTALPELDVGFLIQFTVFRHARHILRPHLHRLSPLDQDRDRPRPGQGQGTEKPRRSGSHHQRRMGKAGCRQGRQQFLRNADAVFVLPQDGVLVFHPQIQAQHEMYVALVPGVHAPPVQGDPQQLLRRDSQPPDQQLPQLLLRIVQRHRKARYSQHPLFSSFMGRLRLLRNLLFPDVHLCGTASLLAARPWLYRPVSFAQAVSLSRMFPAAESPLPWPPGRGCHSSSSSPTFGAVGSSCHRRAAGSVKASAG